MASLRFEIALSALLGVSVAACASSPPPASAVPAAPLPAPATPPPTAPTAAVAANDPANAAPTTAPPKAPALAPFAPPAGFAWLQASADYVLAARSGDAGDAGGDGKCEVWQISTQKKVADLTGNDVAAGGANVVCTALSPAGKFVLYGNGRRSAWKNWKDQTTMCSGVMAPDDSSCIDDDTTPFAFQEKDGPAANLDLFWSKPVPKGPHKKVATIPRGLNRNGPDDKWWTVRYCSPDKAVIDITNGARITVDAKTGASKTAQSDGSPICP